MFTNRQQQRFVLINVVPPNIYKEEAEKELDELISLVSTYGGATVVRVIQRRASPDASTFIGAGKAQELIDIVAQEKIDVVVLNSIVSPTQLFNLKKMLWKSNTVIEVWDRVDLILHIFAKHATTAEAKLQIDLARMRHMGPHIYGLGGTVLSRQGGGIGTRGIGETNTERMKRHWRNEMKEITDKLKKMTADRVRQLETRREKGLTTISIVGYTNAGKSTLFNSLTHKNKLAKDVLFATLDSSVGHIYVPEMQKKVLVSDTIGFIQNLPAKLIDAFKSTLMESIHADLLLHVIDAADPKMHEKIKVVETVLQDLEIQGKKIIYVFNKVDKLNAVNTQLISEKYKTFFPQFISAANGNGVEELKKQAIQLLRE